MGEVPKIVKQRLATGQRAAEAGAHLDPDLMAALAEKRLEGEERERVLAHLAQCTECREVAALAAPGEEATQTVVRPVRRRFWLFQPNVLRWGAVAASVAVVAIAVSLYRPKPQRAVSTTAEQAPAATAPAAANEVRIQAQPSEAKKGETVATLESPPPKQKLQAPEKEEMAAGRAVKDEGEYRATAPVAAGAMAKAAPAMAATEAAGKAGEAAPTMMAEKSAAGNVPAAVAPAATAESAAMQKLPEAAAADKFALQRAAPARTQAAETVEVQAAAPAVQAQTVMKTKRDAAAARWSISNDGEVQVSHTGGAPWTTVAIAKGVRFRAVAAVGANVWAGGSGGALYHSTDGGATWVRVEIGTSEDIVRVTFKDAQHGTATGASGAQWTTEDGGQSWKARQ